MSHRNNRELRKRFQNGNFKVCSSDKLLVLKRAKPVVVALVEDLTLTRLMRIVSHWMIECHVNSVAANSMKQLLQGISQFVNKNIKPI